MFGLLIKAGIGLGKVILTEKLFVMLVARGAAEALEKMAESTETDVDDNMVKPIIEALKKYF